MTLDDLRASRSAVVTVADTARLLGVNERTVSRACQDGQLPSILVGRRRLVIREKLLAMLEGGSGPEVSLEVSPPEIGALAAARAQRARGVGCRTPGDQSSPLRIVQDAG